MRSDMRWWRDKRGHGSRSRLAAFLSVGCLLVLAATLVQAAQHRSWLAAAVDGDVRRYIPYSTAWRQVVVGDRLNPGTRILTGPDGQLTIIRGRDSVEVGSNSEFVVSGDPDNPPDDIFQSLGRLLFVMETRDSRDFTVETPLLVATVKGTRFVVTVSSGDTTVTVEEGTVEVTARATGATALLEPGMTARVSVDGDGLEVTALEAPEATGTLGGTVDAAADAVGGAVGGTRDAVGGAGNAAGGAAGSAGDAAGGAAGAAGDAAGGAAGAAGDAAGGAGGLF